MPESQTFFIAKRRVHRKRRTPVASNATLNLFSAQYNDAEGNWVRLTFGRPIDIRAINPAAIQVSDGEFSGELLQGVPEGTIPLGLSSVRVMLVSIGEVESGPVLLSATALSGIVAVDDGGTWGGVMDLELPFP